MEDSPAVVVDRVSLRGRGPALPCGRLALVGFAVSALLVIPAAARARASDCASVTGSPATVKLGQVLSFHASATSSAAGCGAPGTWTWLSAPGPHGGPYSIFQLVSGCGTGQASCVVRAHDLEAAGRPLKSQFCVGGGGWGDCAPFEILPLSVSGTVTKATAHGAQPAAGVSVFAGERTGQFNATTLTNAKGQYTFKLALGWYVIEAGRRDQFYTAAPHATTFAGNTSSEVIDVTSDTGGVNFVGKRPSPPSLTVLLSAPARVRSGLAVHDLYGGREESLVDFVAARRSPGFAADTDQCESGCADLLATVRDAKTHQPVENAKVDVRVTSGLEAPGGIEYVCERDQATGRTMGAGDCDSSSLLDLRTDESGRVYLRYWAPGVIKATPVTIQVTASGGRCVGGDCEGGTQLAVASRSLTIEPYLIYDHSTTLSEDDITELANWAAGPSLFRTFLSGTTWAATALSAHLKWLEAEELASEKEIEALEHLEAPPVRVLHAAIDVYDTWTELSEHWAMVGLFLQDTALSGTGLGDAAHEDSAKAYPAYAFTKQLADYNGLVPGDLGQAVGKDFGEAGAWWDIATTLHALVESKDASVAPGSGGHWGIRLQLYEISHCDPHGQCDPGYDGDDGIDGELDVRIALLDDGHEKLERLGPLHLHDPL